ncbi:histidine phosphatase family protein [Paraburkholderia sp. HP33-1]|uniref:histidine phosphatase family protein n=1 Tax=Paraburkholderia sp. HP33-1 TaxID=2883243 RepID=UPI001F3FE322|nr:histidine phosphatase family protein [Paraburkholderia sp. HP33-1]
MTTTTIMVIRHAEKPDHQAAGVDANGRPDSKSLTPQGWQRAGALVQFMAPGSNGEPRSPLARPKYLLAAYADPATDDDSKRPQQTITPLAAHLGTAIPFDCSIGKDQLQKLVEKATGAGGTVLIAWEHKRIPEMARMLVARGETVPDWPDDRFDMVWVLSRAGAEWSLTQVPQMLLASDQSDTFTSSNAMI